MTDVFSYFLHNQTRRRCHVVGRRRTRAEGISWVSLEWVTCAVWTHPVLQGNSRHIRTFFGARLKKLPEDGTANGKTMSFWHNAEEGNWMMNFHSGHVAGFTHKLVPQVIAVVSHITHLSILYANKRHHRHVSAASGVPLKTGMNKSPIHYLRSGRRFFRLISLVSLSFTVIHDCLFLSTVIQFCGVWQKMAASSWRSYTKQVLLVRA